MWSRGLPRTRVRESAPGDPEGGLGPPSGTADSSLFLLRRWCFLLVHLLHLLRVLLLAVALLGRVGAGLLHARGLLLLHRHALLRRRLLLRGLVFHLLLLCRSGGRGRRRGLGHREPGRTDQESRADEQRNHLSHVFSPPFRIGIVAIS